MLRPLFAQAHAPLRGSKLSSDLRAALEWWEHTLQNARCEIVHLRAPALPVVDVFTDASGKPPCAAAVMHDQGRFAYTVSHPSGGTLAEFQERSDDQIMALELLAVVLALASFKAALVGRNVRLWIDNQGGQFALLRGSAKALDHNRLVHEVWSFALRHGIGLWLERVPSALNIADEPSRGETSTVRGLGAQLTEPSLQLHSGPSGPAQSQCAL